MSLFPLDPRFTKVILASVEHQCLEEALTVISLLSGESIFTDPPAKRQQAYVARSRYLSIYLLFLSIYRIVIPFLLLHNPLAFFYKHLRRENPLRERDFRDEINEHAKDTSAIRLLLYCCNLLSARQNFFTDKSILASRQLEIFKLSNPCRIRWKQNLNVEASNSISLLFKPSVDRSTPII